MPLDVQWEIGPNAPLEVAGTISGAGGIIKQGGGTLHLTASNTYTGDTVVDSGVLRLTDEYLANTADLALKAGATLELSHALTDTIDEFFVGGLSRGEGTHGAIGSGADFEWSQITGAGKLQVTTFSGLAGDYNRNSVVDAADYTVWRNNVGAPASGLANAIDGGVVGTAHYETWRANYGKTQIFDATGNTAPEPSTALLLILGCSGSLQFRRARRRNMTYSPARGT
jgi:autotransporter-associated beta strand protein